MLFSQQHTYNYHQDREILADPDVQMMPQRQMIPGHDDQGHIPVLRAKRPKLRSSEVEIDGNNGERLSIGNHASPVDHQCSSVSYDSCRQQTTTKSLESSPQQQNSVDRGKADGGDADGRIDLGRPPPPLYPHGNGWTYPASFGYANVGNDHATKLTVDVDCGASDEGAGRNSNSTATANSSETLSYSTNKGSSLSNYHSQYYNSAVYNSQYYNPTGAGSLYGGGNQNYLSQTYGKSFKSSPYSSLGVYLGTNSMPSASAYYNNYSSTGLGSQQVLGNHSTFDYSSAYGCYNGSYYPSNSTSAYGNAANIYGAAGASQPGTGSGVAAAAAAAVYQQHLSHLASAAAAGAPLMHDAGSIDPLTGLPKMGETKRGKGKKRKLANMSPTPENTFDRVFIWDLEETCILLQSLLNGSFAAKYNKDASAANALGAKLEEMALNLDAQFSFNDLEDFDQVHIDDATADEVAVDVSCYTLTSDGFQIAAGGNSLCLAPNVRGGVDWVRKLALRYKRIKEIYDTYKNNVATLIGCGKSEEWLSLRTELESLTDSWHTLVAKCLSVIASRYTPGLRCANVLVTSKQLVPTLSKLLMFNMASLFPIENIYSAAKIGKEACFERIMSRFGKKCTYLVVGDGRDEEVASKQLNIPFWRVTSHADLNALNHALELGHL